MIPLGDCSECGASLAADQRYCVDCGSKVAEGVPNPFVLSPAVPVADAGKRPLLPVRPQMASIYAASALGFGVVVGTGISPNLTGINAAAPTVITLPGPGAPSSPAPLASAGGGGGGGGASVGGGSPATTSSFVGKTTSGGGGRRHKSHKKNRKQVQTATGTVVHANPVAGSYAIAPSAGGPLIAIHAEHLQQPGTLIKVPIRILHNGTDAEAGALETLGTSMTASFAGTVTFVDAGAGVYTVSSRGTSVLVHLPPANQNAPAPILPKVADSVLVDVSIKQPPVPALAPTNNPQGGDLNCPDVNAALPPGPPAAAPPAYLEQTSVSVATQAASPTYISGIVRATCAGPNLLVVSADDAGESGRSIVLKPDPAAGIDVSKLHVGQPLELRATPPANQADPYLLLGLTSDEMISGADDPSTTQGTL